MSKKNIGKTFFHKKRGVFHSFFVKISYNRQIFCNFAVRMEMSIKVHNRLLDLSSPKVMAIVNLTPDSFYTSCGGWDEDRVLAQVGELLAQGADIIDMGACSTRPNYIPVDAKEEWDRLYPLLKVVRSQFPNAILSVDTFRVEIAEKSLELGIDIINDVSGGDKEGRMWKIIAQHRVPYVLTFAQEPPKHCVDYDYTMADMLDFFQRRLDNLHRIGVSDVIIDPGFGFAKTEQQNYAILRQLDTISVLRVPVLVGISRKSMLYKPLEIQPSEVLPATIAANTLALERGAHILRVHDVVAAKQAIAIYSLTHKN